MLVSQNIDVVTFRSPDMKERLDRLALLDRRKRSQMARVLMEDAVERKEKELGLPPLGDDAA